MGRQLLAGRAVEPAIEGQSLQQIGDLAAAVRRTQHDNTAELRRPVPRDIDSRQQAAHRMADEVKRSRVLSGKIRDRRMNMVGEKVERLSPAGVVEVERGKAGLPQRPVEFPERPGGARDAVKQYHSCLLYTSPSPRDGLLSRMPS